ncbi:MAG: hypothetical protein HQK89_07300 [Nitrospirae bacterium]|nr:hypothetical protein [Nitrospirota bacterium]
MSYEIEVKWAGPFTVTEIILGKKDRTDDYGLFQVYGEHILSGRDTLLYIGIAINETFSANIGEIKDWLYEVGDISIYLGDTYNSNKHTVERDYFTWRRDTNIANNILIYKYTPNYNTIEEEEPILHPFDEVHLIHKGKKHRLREIDSAPNDFSSLENYSEKKRIYITYCSAKKNDKLVTIPQQKVTPDNLYLGKDRIEPFMQQCSNTKVDWAILSDKYGIWFSKESNYWYEKDPNTVNEEEYIQLLQNFNTTLREYDEIWFYYKNLPRLHSLYQRLLKDTDLTSRIRLFNNYRSIVNPRLYSVNGKDLNYRVDGVDTELCIWLHEQLAQLPLIRYPFNLDKLPNNGIYFFYEQGEHLTIDENQLRIVRIGTHRGDGEFNSRINQHYRLDLPQKIKLEIDQSTPKDRSIFRKNIGRVLLSKYNPDYLPIWDVDLTLPNNRKKYKTDINIQTQETLEDEISKILREKFSFRYLLVNTEEERINLESSLIGTVAYNIICKPSQSWLGIASPLLKIKESGLWQTQHLKANPISKDEKISILESIKYTETFNKLCQSLDTMSNSPKS